MPDGGSFEKMGAARAKSAEREWRQESLKTPLDEYREVCAELNELNGRVSENTKELKPGELLRGVELNKKDILRILELEEKKKKLEIDNQLSEADLEDGSADLGATLQ